MQFTSLIIALGCFGASSAGLALCFTTAVAAAELSPSECASLSTLLSAMGEFVQVADKLQKVTSADIVTQLSEGSDAMSEDPSILLKGVLLKKLNDAGPEVLKGLTSIQPLLDACSK